MNVRPEGCGASHCGGFLGVAQLSLGWKIQLEKSMVRTTKRFAAIAALLMVLPVFGCAIDPSPHARYPTYAISVYNSTTGSLRECRLWWPLGGKEWWAFDGAVDAGGYAENVLQPDPIPKSATLQWKTPDGVFHRHEVEITSKVQGGDRFTGTIWVEFFDLTDNGCRVMAISDSERHRQGEEGVFYPPSRR
jgi:hypothetical protein